MESTDINFIFQKSNLSKDLMERKFGDKKIFITGGTGFIGKWLLASLQKIREEIEGNLHLYVLTRNSKKFRNNFSYLAKDVHFIEGSVEDKTTFKDLKKDFNYIFHFSGETAIDLKKLDDYFEVSVLGTNNLLKYVVSDLTETFFFASSGAVYRNFEQINKRISESDPCVDLNDQIEKEYGFTKKKCENILEAKLNNHNCNLVNFRIFALSGPFMYFDRHYAFGNFLLNASKGQEIAMSTDGQVFRSFMHVRDFMVWILRLLKLDLQESHLNLNVGSDRASTVRDLAQLIADKYSLNVIYSEKASKNKQYYVPSIDLAKSMNLDIYTNLEECISLTMQHLNP